MASLGKRPAALNNSFYLVCGILDVMEITKIIEWDMGHRVPNNRNKCQHPHGHRYRLEVTLAGPLNSERGSSSEGMVLDFTDLKQLLREHIHDPLDHCFMIYDQDPIMAPFAAAHSTELKLVVMPFIPTAENIVLWCYETLRARMPESSPISRLRLYETPNSWADYYAKTPAV